MTRLICLQVLLTDPLRCFLLLNLLCLSFGYNNCVDVLVLFVPHLIFFSWLGKAVLLDRGCSCLTSFILLHATAFAFVHNHTYLFNDVIISSSVIAVTITIHTPFLCDIIFYIPHWRLCVHRCFYLVYNKKGKRNVEGVPQPQAAAIPRHQEEEETDNTKQAQIEQTYEKLLRLALSSSSEVIATLKGQKKTTAQKQTNTRQDLKQIAS